MKDGKLRMEYVHIMNNKNKFRESLEYFRKHEEYL